MASDYKTETTLDVAAEIRRRTTRHTGRMVDIYNEIADRIEAAYKRDKKQWAREMRTRRCVPKVNDGLSFLILVIFAANGVVCAITANLLGISGWLCAITWLMYSGYVEGQHERFVRDLWDAIDETGRKEGDSHDDE